MSRLFFAFRVAVLLFVSLLFYTPGLFAQAPAIKYTTPHQYKINTPVTPLKPTNTGGAVPATIYGQVSRIAGGGAPGSFVTLTGVAVDPSGNVFIADWGSSIIYKLTAAGKLSVFAGNGAFGWADGLGKDATFSEPDALVADAAGNVYVSDLQTHLIRKITPAGMVSTFAGKPNNAGANNGIGSAAKFNGPRGLAIDPAGNIYVADQANNLIRKITPAGKVTTYAGSGAIGAADGKVESASFNTPTGVGLDAAGNLYVSDAGSGFIRKITPDGFVTTIAKGFNYPRELRVDGAGNIYVAEQNGNTIKRISPTGQVTIIAGGNQPDAAGVKVNLSGPLGMAIDGKGNLFIGENGNNDVRKIIITGYTIDKPLSAGLVFDPKTGIISGTPTALSAPTVYTITALNTFGISSTTVSIEILRDIVLKPSTITFPPGGVIDIDAGNILHPGATSTNKETPISYTSSDPSVAYVGADGQIHVIAPGETTITANQNGNDNYSPAVPTHKTFTIAKQNQEIIFPLFAGKNTCTADFPVGATSATSAIIPLTYSSADPDVATVSAAGIIHIVGPGTALITVSQSGNSLYNTAVNQLRSLMVAGPVKPKVKITPSVYGSCDGMVLTYTAETIDAGNNPTYQWKLNGQNSGDNSDTYTSTLMRTGDVLTCIVFNNDGCEPIASDISNQASTVSNPYVTLTLTISSSANGTVPLGTPITFKAVLNINNITEATYQWYVNGQPVGTNNAKFTSNTLLDGDLVTCAIAAGGECIANPSVASNAIMVSISIPEKVTVPNAFTPNGDGYNDTWYISGLISYINCTVNIYNRYGAMVYNSVGYQHPWDGTSNGKQVPPGVYYYVIDTKSDQQKLSGQVTVLR